MESHDWDQDSVEVRVDVPIAAIKAKDVAYTLTPHALTLGVKGSPPLFDAEKLLDTVKVDDSLWEIETLPEKGRCVRVTLRKCSPDVPWEFLFKKDDVPPDLTPTHRCFFDVAAGGVRRPHRHGPVRERHAQDVRELPRAVHGREGRRPLGHAAHLQGLQVPPRHPQLHVPGRRLHSRRRHRRREYLRRKVRGRKLQSEALEARSPVHGQRGAGHQRLAVFLTTTETPHLDGKHVVFGEVLEGYDDVVKKVEALGSHSGKTSADVVVVDCGVL